MTKIVTWCHQWTKRLRLGAVPIFLQPGHVTAASSFVQEARPLALHATAAPGRGRRWITSFALGASMSIWSVMAGYYTGVQCARSIRRMT